MVASILVAMLTSPIRVGYGAKWIARSNTPHDLNRSGWGIGKILTLTFVRRDQTVMSLNRLGVGRNITLAFASKCGWRNHCTVRLTFVSLCGFRTVANLSRLVLGRIRWWWETLAIASVSGKTNMFVFVVRRWGVTIVTLLDQGSDWVHLDTSAFANANVRLFRWSQRSPSGLVGYSNRTSQHGLVLVGKEKGWCWRHVTFAIANVQWCGLMSVSLGRLVRVGTTRTNRHRFVQGGMGGMGVGWCRLGVPSLLGFKVDSINILTFTFISILSLPNRKANAFAFT
jgi:hypothetical protein